MPWLGRLAVNGRVASFGDTLQRNLLGLAALGRVVPGVVFVVMIACGWTRVPLTRVALASLVSSALYLPLMLYLVIVFGDAMDDRAGLWTWPFLLGVLVAMAFMRYRVFTFSENGKSRAVAGMPARPRRRIQFARPQVQPLQLPEFMKLRVIPGPQKSTRLQ
jgi:membrane protein DedA with SNARE-associated domain